MDRKLDVGLEPANTAIPAPLTGAGKMMTMLLPRLGVMNYFNQTAKDVS